MALIPLRHAEFPYNSFNKKPLNYCLSNFNAGIPVGNKVSSRKHSADVATHKKKHMKERAPRRPLVCIPCKKRFTRRRKLDDHNRLVHNTSVRFSCDNCDKTFSRRDHLVRHVKHGKCPATSQQTTPEAELSFTSDETQLLDELSMFIF